MRSCRGRSEAAGGREREDKNEIGVERLAGKAPDLRFASLGSIPPRSSGSRIGKCDLFTLPISPISTKETGGKEGQEGKNQLIFSLPLHSGAVLFRSSFPFAFIGSKLSRSVRQILTLSPAFFPSLLRSTLERLHFVLKAEKRPLGKGRRPLLKAARTRRSSERQNSRSDRFFPPSPLSSAQSTCARSINIMMCLCR